MVFGVRLRARGVHFSMTILCLFLAGPGFLPHGIFATEEKDYGDFERILGMLQGEGLLSADDIEEDPTNYLRDIGQTREQYEEQYQKIYEYDITKSDDDDDDDDILRCKRYKDKSRCSDNKECSWDKKNGICHKKGKDKRDDDDDDDVKCKKQDTKQKCNNSKNCKWDKKKERCKKKNKDDDDDDVKCRKLESKKKCNNEKDCDWDKKNEKCRNKGKNDDDDSDDYKSTSSDILSEILSSSIDDAKDDDDWKSYVEDSSDVPTETPFYGYSSHGFYGSSFESSSDNHHHSHHDSHGGSHKSSAFYGMYGVDVDSSSAYREDVYKTDDGRLKVSFVLSLGSDYEYSQAEEEELKFKVSTSIQESTARLGIGRYLDEVYIGSSGEYENSTTFDIDVIFSQNSHGVYQFAQMLRENVIYVFPLEEYTGVDVTDVQVAPYSGSSTYSEGPLPDGPYAGRLAGRGSDGNVRSPTGPADSFRQEWHQDPEPVPSSGGCVLDRFSLNGVPSCCFAPFHLDARFECCKEPSGVDECGVCGGMGQSCAISFSTRIGIPIGADISSRTSKDYTKLILQYQQGIALLLSEFNVIALDIDVTSTSPSAQGGVLRRLLQQTDAQQNLQQLEEQIIDVTAVMMPRSGMTLPSITNAKSLFQQAARQKAEYEDLQFLSVVEVKRIGVCSNGLCEVGEMSDPLNPTAVTGTCPQDCPITKLCPMPIRPAVGLPMTPCASMGSCNEETGKCSCQAGYSGEACSTCSTGYFKNGYTCEPACAVSPGLKMLVVGEPHAVCSDRGTCDADLGQCRCLNGYTGEDCGKCAENFVARGQICVPGRSPDSESASMVGALELKDGDPASDNDNHATLVTGIIIALAVVLAIIAALLAIAISAQRRRQSAAGSASMPNIPKGNSQSGLQYGKAQQPDDSDTCLDRQISELNAYESGHFGLISDCTATDPDLPTRQSPTGAEGSESSLIQQQQEHFSFMETSRTFQSQDSSALGLGSTLPLRESPRLDTTHLTAL